MPHKAKVKVELSPHVKAAWDILKGQNPSKPDGFYFGGITSTGEPLEYNNRACHFDMMEMRAVDAFYTFMPPVTFTQKSTPDLFFRYTKWLITESPWKNVPDKVDVVFATEHGFVISNLELPANLVGNFCIATRQPAEYWAKIVRWGEFCDAGVHPNVAFLFASGLWSKNTWRSMATGHEPLDIHNMSKRAAYNFYTGTVGSPNHLLRRSLKYTPCNKVWEPKSLDQRTPIYWSFLDKTYPSNGPGKESTRMFTIHDPESLEYGWSDLTLFRSKEQWTEIALAESKRMKDEQDAA